MSKRSPGPVWSPREDLPGQTDMIPLLDALVFEAPPPAPSDNGGPPLDEHPGQVIARIGEAMYGRLWIGKLASDLAEDHRTVRRWVAGECKPSPAKVARARTVAEHHVARILLALG